MSNLKSRQDSSMWLTGDKKYLDLLWLYAVPGFVILFIIGFIYLFWNLIYMTEQFSREIAIHDAERFHTAVNEFRDYYSEVIVTSLNGSDVEITHNYQDVDHAIPLPATLTRELGLALTETNALSMSFYSNNPFPWREEDLEAILNDSFKQRALLYLKANPNDTFYEFTTNELTGQQELRYATPSVMSENCVACHNNHLDSPVKDWEVGDVRGVLELSVPISSFSVVSTRWTSFHILVSSLILFFSAAGLSIVGFNLRKFSLNAIEDRANKLEIEIGEKAVIEEKLKVAVKESEHANQLKSEFLATMSHELRTPLNAIIGYSEMLEEEASMIDDDMWGDDLGRIKNSGRHLLSIINDILDLSKIEAEKLDISAIETDVKHVLYNIESLVQPTLTKNLNELIIHVDPQIDLIWIDQIRLTQILSNLVINAAKFTQNGKIFIKTTVETKVGQPLIRFDVIDNGIGISDSLLKNLFTPFTQGDSSLRRKYGGTGLGLVITKKLCELMGGSIQVESEVGQGSTFSVWLPFHPVTLQEPDYSGVIS